MRFLLLSLFFLSSCGYHMGSGERISVSVPYVVGDYEGELTEALARALSHTSQFRYSRNDGQWILKAKIIDTTNRRIGYRYNRQGDDPEIKRGDNILGVENRKTITARISVEHAITGKVIIAQQEIKADADYDYVDPNALSDISFVNPGTGRVNTSVAFSLGQLDSVEAAGDDATYPIYRVLAQKIVDGLISSGVCYGE